MDEEEKAALKKAADEEIADCEEHTGKLDKVTDIDFRIMFRAGWRAALEWERRNK